MTTEVERLVMHARELRQSLAELTEIERQGGQNRLARAALATRLRKVEARISHLTQARFEWPKT